MASEYSTNLSGVQMVNMHYLCTYYGLKTGLVFKWLKTRWLILPFKNWTKLCPENGHLNTGLSGFQMVTVDEF
jgi:hypothetical protein